MGSYFDTLTKDDEKKKKEKSYSYFDTQPTVRKKEPVKVDPKILASQERYKALRQQKIPSTKTISHIIPALKDTFKSSIGLDDTQFPEGMGLGKSLVISEKNLHQQ